MEQFRAQLAIRLAEQKQIRYCRKCKQVVPPPERASYGGFVCENCWVGMPAGKDKSAIKSSW